MWNIKQLEIFDTAEVEILPMAASEPIGVITYSSLGAGLLIGKYGLNNRPKQGHLVEDTRYGDRYGAHEDLFLAFNQTFD